jgi:hypothetical protein
LDFGPLSLKTLGTLVHFRHFRHFKEVFECRTFGCPAVIITGIMDKIKAGGSQDLFGEK